MHEPRRLFALSGQHFSAPAARGTRTAQACSSLTGGEFFAEPQRGVALCGARETAAPAAGAKRKGHLRFPFLFELLPFPCLLARRKSESGDRFEIRERQSGYSCVSFSAFSQFTDSVLLHIRATLRRCGMTVPHNSLARYNRQGLRR